MRPVRLELEGFAAFRDRTVIDFEGAELFALCGPTGAGKTTVIDGITFALYGSVPRLGDLRAVAPVLSQGRVEARVRLDFTVGGTGYTAVRVVRATKSGGASTKEARLERDDGQLLADDADHLTAAVGQLLGLDFRQFTTCVSLPQGDFARFLHDKPRDRQDLLVRLLDLGLYELVATAARQRAAIEGERAVLADARLAQLAGATPEAVASAASRVALLSALRDRVDAARPRLDAFRASVEAAVREATASEAAVGRIAAVVIPEGITELASSVKAATEAHDLARNLDAQAAEALAKVEAALAALPTRASIEAAIRDHDESAQLAAQVEKGAVAVATSVAADVAAVEALTAAEAVLVDALAARDAARTAELAHTLAAELVVGQPCPVCLQPVGKVHRISPPKVAAAEKAVKAAEKVVANSRKTATAATAERARVEQKLASAEAQQAELTKRLKSAPDRAALGARLAELSAAETAVNNTKKGSAQARTQRDKAERDVERARAAEVKARSRFDEARDRLASLEPPAPTRTDLGADWSELASWAAKKRPELDAAVVLQREAAAQHRAALERVRGELADGCRAVGLDPDDRPRDVVVDALAQGEADRRRLEEELAEAGTIRETAAQSTDAVAVARALADHLAANRFEQWLLETVLHQLVEGATTLLRDLSGGAYSLVIDSRSRAFAVVDHVNADAIRPARTLSGGETFLASLALALALADQVALVAGSAARLETILLDEGFGTLDLDTLDVVAGALEELGARGRLVGIVTHVRELAERLPVRYEIRKVAGAATVDRINA